MPPTPLYDDRDYTFGDLVLRLRERAHLTQAELAALVGVSERAIQKWEGGLNYPGAEVLRGLIAVHLRRGAFAAGGEAAEAEALWDTVRGKAVRRRPPFDRAWFASLRGETEAATPSPHGGAMLVPPPLAAPSAPPQQHAWGEAPDVAQFYGRAQEMDTLSRWALADRCRLVALLGMGGIGKTALAAKLARVVALEFDYVYWRSLRNAPPAEEWLAGAINLLAPPQSTLPDGVPARLALLLDLLRDRRALLVLDNLETVLEPGAREGYYREGYEGYGTILQRLGEVSHQGCVLVTSREKPPELGPLEGEGAPVCSLRLDGLAMDEGRALLRDKALVGDEVAWHALVERYAGNALALKIVGETIGELFGGDIATFLAQGEVVFGGIRRLLDAQLVRLSALECTLLYELAVEREPVPVATLMADAGARTPRDEVFDAVEALRRRSLIERGEQSATVVLQPVVLGYITERLIREVSREVEAREPLLVARHALVKATSKDDVRRSQERLIAQPLLARLSGSLGGTDAVERRLRELLGAWRGRPPEEQGYGPGNVVNLLRLLRGDLRGLDLSRLSIRHAFLQGVETQDANLEGAHLSEAVLAGDFSYPTAVALSVDGASLAMGTSTGEVCLRRVVDRTLLVAVQGHTGPTLGVALSADGSVLASGSFDGTAKVWEAASGRLRVTLDGHSGRVWGVALSADGRLLASGDGDGTVRLWETEGGQLVAALQGHTGGVRGVALSVDGSVAASGGEDGTVRLWDAPSGRPLATLRGHTGGVHGVALSTDGRLVASSGDDRTIRLWERASGRLRATLQGHNGQVWGVALSADGRVVASSSYDRTVRLWDTESGQLRTILQGHTGLIQGLALSADGRLVTSGSQDGTTGLWDASSGQRLATLQGQTGALWSVALSADRSILVAGSQDGTIRLWDTESGHLHATLHGHTGGARGVALSADGQLVASGSWDATVKLWEAASGRLRATLQGHTGGVPCVALSGDGRVVASGGEDGTVRLWDASTGRLCATLLGHTGVVWGVALSGDGQLVASGSWDGTVKLWEAASGRLLTSLEDHTGRIWCVALSQDGHTVASGSFEGTIRVWEAPSGRPLTTLEGPSSAVYNVALSGNGQLVAGSYFEGTVGLWEAPSGRPLTTLAEPDGGVRCVAMRQDGHIVASGSYDGTATLWDIEGERGRGVVLHTLRGDRRYERLDITGLTGVTGAQRAGLVALGAVEHTPTPAAPLPPAPSARPSPITAIPASTPVPTPATEPVIARPSTRPPTNLPPDRTSFVGRDDDVAALARALDSATHTGARLLTLSGVAGSGKTRLALAVADMVRDGYEEGAWLVGLAPLPADATADPTVVAAAALNALGLHEQPGQAPPDTLVGRLQPRRLLLILDNCEHVVASCAALVARLLEACPGLRILATSQLPLGIAEETVWRVDTLTAPDPVAGTPTEATLRLLGQADAVRLFVERAQAVQPGFLLSAENAAAVVAICRRLDGLPLALELAAARLHVLSVDDVLARLDDRFRLLRRGGRTVADRHQALQATMDWSYGILDPTEQALLRRLAVFAGGWELTAAEAVCAGEEVAAEAVLELLDELLDRALVYVYDMAGAPRYGLLETVRQYGAQQLERAGETAALQDQRLRWCVALAEQAAPALLGPEQAVWLARLEREHDNLRAALQWALDRGHSALGVRLAAGLWQFWRSRSYLSEGRRWLEALLALPAADEDAASRAVRASALEGAAWLTEDEHDFAQAAALFARSDALRRALGQDERLTAGLINAAMEARACGDYARATSLLEESVAQQRAWGNRESIKRGGLGLSLARLALVLAEQGQHARATTLYEECLALHRELGDREGIGNALLGLGDVARDLGDTAGVRAYCEETLALFRDLGHTWVGFSLNNLALAAYLDGDLTLAADRAEESAALFRGLQAGPSLAEALVTLGRVRGAQGEAVAARAHLTEALTLAGTAGPRFVVAAALDELGVQAVRQGQARHGVYILGAAALLRQVMGAPVQPADWPAIEAALGAARASLGDMTFAETWSAGQTLPMEQLVAQAAAPEDSLVAPERADGD